jgi:hypothetical protein
MKVFEPVPELLLAIPATPLPTILLRLRVNDLDQHPLMEAKPTPEMRCGRISHAASLRLVPEAINLRRPPRQLITSAAPVLAPVAPHQIAPLLLAVAAANLPNILLLPRLMRSVRANDLVPRPFMEADPTPELQGGRISHAASLRLVPEAINPALLAVRFFDGR